MKIKAFLLLLLCSQLSSCKSLLDDPCGDWVAFKDEKCLKIFDQYFVSYTDAENICKTEEGALLPSINTEEKQLFIEDFLKSQNVVDNVWIGLKYVNESYVWADGTRAEYVHWASGSPTNDSNYCVQMETDKTLFGYWADIACTKKNSVICEKLQLWSFSKLQSTVINMLKELATDESTLENVLETITNVQSALESDESKLSNVESTLTNVQSTLTDVQSTLTDVQTTLTNVVENPLPIGFIYVQLPKEKPPQEVWSGMKWEDVSSDYAGLFFRTEGGHSASFGEIQQESSPRLATVKEHYGEGYNTEISVPSDGEESSIIFTSYGHDGNIQGPFGLSLQLSKEEVCPRNTAIRIWKRTM